MSNGRNWMDFTYLFKSRKIKPTPTYPITNPDPAKTELRRRIEQQRELKELRRQTAEVWD
jgi:hypothetical protein